MHLILKIPNGEWAAYVAAYEADVAAEKNADKKEKIKPPEARLANAINAELNEVIQPGKEGIKGVTIAVQV